MGSEQEARKSIDRLLAAAGWAVRDFKSADIQGALAVALRATALNEGFGLADSQSCIDGKASGARKAQKRDATHTGLEAKTFRYVQGLPAWRRRPPVALP
jgi:type I restriction enzyme, R subunit